MTELNKAYDLFIEHRLDEAGWISTTFDLELVVFMRARLTEDEADEKFQDENSRWSLEILAKRRHLEQWRMAESAVRHIPLEQGVNNSLWGYQSSAWGAVLIDANTWSSHPDFKEKWKIS